MREYYTRYPGSVQMLEAPRVGASQDYDPVGEISRGAYWVIRSHDGGRTWGRPIYTGLRIQSPYVVRPLSNAPLLAGDHLQVEVKVEELDASSITFPPVGLRAKRVQEGLLLQIPFADLERDSDTDGLDRPGRGEARHRPAEPRHRRGRPARRERFAPSSHLDRGDG